MCKRIDMSCTVGNCPDFASSNVSLARIIVDNIAPCWSMHDWLTDVIRDYTCAGKLNRLKLYNACTQIAEKQAPFRLSAVLHVHF